MIASSTRRFQGFFLPRSENQSQIPRFWGSLRRFNLVHYEFEYAKSLQLQFKGLHVHFPEIVLFSSIFRRPKFRQANFTILKTDRKWLKNPTSAYFWSKTFRLIVNVFFSIFNAQQFERQIVHKLIATLECERTIFEPLPLRGLG